MNRDVEEMIAAATREAASSLEQLAGDVAMEIHAIEEGKTGDLLRRVEEIHKAASDALRHAQAVDNYRRLLWEIK